MNTPESEIARIRNTLCLLVGWLLALAWIALILTQRSHQREMVQDVAAFAHLFLPLWAWGFYALAKRRLLGPPDRSRFCDKCGFDLEGHPRNECPECGTPRRTRKLSGQ